MEFSKHRLMRNAYKLSVEKTKWNGNFGIFSLEDKHGLSPV
jgi:hypothetical protein